MEWGRLLEGGNEFVRGEEINAKKRKVGPSRMENENVIL